MKGFRARHFGFQHRIVSFLSGLSQNFTYTIRNGLAAGMRRKGGLGFLPIHQKETPEVRFLRQLSLDNLVVYDIGGFEGVLTLFFARRAREVITFEPNPRNYERCLENVRLNDLRNVRVMNHGVSDTHGTIDFVYDPLMPGAGSGQADISSQINASVKSARQLRIDVLPLDEDIVRNNLPLPDFIKIDIEGMELPALRGMRQTLLKRHPQLHIEMHGATHKEKSENAWAVVGFLEQCGYRIHEIENDRDIQLATLGDFCPSHLFCTPHNRRQSVKVNAEWRIKVGNSQV